MSEFFLGRGCVFDASAVLVILKKEPGWEVLGPGFGFISAVNLCEVVAKLADQQLPEEKVILALSLLRLDVEIFGSADLICAGMLSPLTRPLGLSFGDRACLALAMRLQRPVVTADRAWRNLSLGLEIRLIR